MKTRIYLLSFILALLVIACSSDPDEFPRSYRFSDTEFNDPELFEIGENKTLTQVSITDFFQNEAYDEVKKFSMEAVEDNPLLDADLEILNENEMRITAVSGGETFSQVLPYTLDGTGSEEAQSLYKLFRYDSENDRIFYPSSCVIFTPGNFFNIDDRCSDDYAEIVNQDFRFQDAVMGDSVAIYFINTLFERQN